MKIKRKPFEPNMTNIRKLVRDEIRHMLKEGIIRFDIDVDNGYFQDSLEVKLDIYMGNEWVTDSRSSVVLSDK